MKFGARSEQRLRGVHPDLVRVMRRAIATTHLDFTVLEGAAVLEKVPIEWGGDWKSFKDGPHWQLPFRSYPK
jgi:peptidoglycan L-alanyl-D-glutamate endopeptidase CwlK